MVSPIDHTGTLMQMDNVAKFNAQQAQVQQLASHIAQEKIGQQQLEKSTEVKQVQKENENSTNVNEDGSSGGTQNFENRKYAAPNKNQQSAEESQKPVQREFRDPYLGNFIDIRS